MGIVGARVTQAGSSQGKPGALSIQTAEPIVASREGMRIRVSSSAVNPVTQKDPQAERLVEADQCESGGSGKIAMKIQRQLVDKPGKTGKRMGSPVIGSWG